MQTIETIEALQTLYGDPVPATVRKSTPHLTDEYAAWIARSRFCVLSTVGPEGTDGSPRGDDGPVVEQFDRNTMLLPDWRGNNLIDSLRNIVRDGRVSLMFMVAGSGNVVRVNGSAQLTADADMLARFDRQGKQPRSVIVITVAEVYVQCARAILRAGLWTDGDQSDGLPTPGQIVAAITDGELGGEAYDRAWPERAKKSMW